jgi:4-hydroxybenzoate polyprenyltransferase
MATSALAAMRPRQWTKNLLLFAGIVFAVKIGEAGRWAHAVASFAAYCAASSASYLANDVRDAEYDRRHPVKRWRPVAAGELAPRDALLLATILAGAAIAGVAVLGWQSLAFMAAFLALQAAYTWGLKHLILLDVMVIAALFVIRAAAGAAAVDVRISPWLLLCTALLALFLALGKRHAELANNASDSSSGRPVLDGYSPALVDQLTSIVAASTVMAYSMYTFTARDSSAMMVTIPFVLFGIFRYMLLLQRARLGEAPEEVVLRDLPLAATILGWVVTCGVVLSVT